MTDRIEQLFMERAKLRASGSSHFQHRATQTGFVPVSISPAPASLPILGGNQYQGFPEDQQDGVMPQQTSGKNYPVTRLLDQIGPAAEAFSTDFGAAFQQYRVAEVEKQIEAGSLKPIDYRDAIRENPDVPLGDYYESFSNTFTGVPSDDYILHQGRLYPRQFLDATTGETVDLSEDSVLMNIGRWAMSAFMTDPLGVGTSAVAPTKKLVQSMRGEKIDPGVLASGIVSAGIKSADKQADITSIGFYSAVNRAVKALPMDKGSAAQMRAMIAKSEGVKPEEMAWIGLDDFLRGKKSVTKAEVQEYVQANQVQIEEVTKRGDVPQRTADEWQDLINNAEAQGDYDAADALTQQWEAAEGLGGTAYPDSPKFASYTLPGGENYREVLLTLPTAKPVPITELPDGYEVALLEGHPTAKYTLVGPSGVGAPVGGSTLEAATEQAINRLSVNPPKAAEFTDGHFDEPNVLAHMRLNDRTGPNGERILFIEEIQSDWHQKGRKSGYQQNTVTQDSAKEFFGIDDAEWSKMDDATRQSYVDEILEGGQHIREGMREQVPDAPMKKTWHEMSFRRVARMAAEENYDAIAWTPGKMQSERYDLSDQVDILSVEKVSTEDGYLGEYLVSGRSGASTEPSFIRAVSAEELSEVIGKDLSEKAIKDVAADPSGSMEYTGVDLQVGGEGMKGFYDKMLKNYAGKWGKKFGAKVGVTAVETEPGEMARRGGPDSPLERTLKKEQVWTLPITKKMRNSIMEKGVPTFAVGGAAALSQAEGDRNGN